MDLFHDATETTFNRFTTLLSNTVFVEFFLSGSASAEAKPRFDTFANC